MYQAIRITVGIASAILVLLLPLFDSKGRDNLIWGAATLLGALGVILCFGQ